MPREGRALLVYDGGCAFCRLWIDRWRLLAENRVQFVTSQEIAVLFPEMPRERYARAVLLIDEDGTRFHGAEAVFRLLAKRSGFGWAKKLYDAPAIAPVSDLAYRFIARHRPFFLRGTRLLWGKTLEPARYGLTARIFLQALSALFFFAFVSLFSQLPGLVGERGLLPIQSFLEALRAERGFASGWIAPTLAWFGPHAGVLQFMTLLGMLAALLSFGGILIGPCMLLMWTLYLSLVVAGQSFAGSEGDLLLLEAGFLAIFLVPFGRSTGYRSRLEASETVVWLYRFLLFRVTLASGLVKLFLGNGTRQTFSLLSFSLETQALPTPFAWFMQQAPEAVLKVGAGATLFFGLAVPFLFLLPRRARRAGAVFASLFHGFCLVAGAPAFFHWLSMALCLLLLDDAVFERFIPVFLGKRSSDPALRKPRRSRALPALAAMLVMLGLTRLLAPFVRIPVPALLLAATIAPLRISNEYGFLPFAPLKRHEIVFEGSEDGVVWKEYGFAFKPGDAKRAPGWSLLSDPRLDRRLSNAARGKPEDHPWVTHMMIRLLQGSEPVLRLLKTNPFPGTPPKYVRATLYAYRFTTFEERARDGAWWRREMESPYLPTLSLDASTEGGKN